MDDQQNQGGTPTDQPTSNPGMPGGDQPQGGMPGGEQHQPEQPGTPGGMGGESTPPAAPTDPAAPMGGGDQGGTNQGATS